jgi:hypothetical protein
MEDVMHKFLLVAVSACALAGCTAREQQLLAVGAVGAVAGAVIANEVYQPQPQRHVHYQPRPRYEEHYIPFPSPVPPRRPHCFSQWEHTRHGMVERQVCRRY